jgi:phosphatidylinositol-3-phosphatase
MPKTALWSMLILGAAAALIFAFSLLWVGRQPLLPPPLGPKRNSAVPRYEHIFVIIVENKSYEQIFGHPEWAPAINKLAGDYGTAIHFYSEVHPSEGNYVAILGGDTFGIHDDDAYYCRPRLKDPACPNSDEQDYATHDIRATSLADQLTKKGLSWKAYMEDFPTRTPLVTAWPSPEHASVGHPAALYASKHNGFLNFRSLNHEPPVELDGHLAGFDQLERDLASGAMPNYAQIVPDQCNDMHGLSGSDVPPDCSVSNLPELVRRGDAKIGIVVTEILRSKVWSSRGNAAIVITFDESDGSEPSWAAHGCCGSDPGSVANFGGGHIPTIVITNHGPRRFLDATPYNHYSLLRTTEAAFGIHDYLRRAADTRHGVVTMAPLFAVRG